MEYREASLRSGDKKGSTHVVLVVDDDDDDCLLVKSAFKDVGEPVELRFAADGRELMEYLHDCRNANPYPDLILLDLNMPRKDGREVLEDLRTDPTFQKIPVVILTTSSADRDVDLCYSMGANSFIVKPSSYDELLETIRMIVQYWFTLSRIPRLQRDNGSSAS